MDKPIFLFCQPRSGSTLVQRVLNSLDNVIIYGEHLGVLKGIASSYRSFSGPDATLFCSDNPDRGAVAKTALEQLRTSEKFPATCCGFSIDHVREAHRDYVRNLVHCIPDVKGYRWGFKEIRYCEKEGDSVFEMLYELFPEATFVFNVRNPADYVASNEGMGSWPGPRENKLKVWRTQVACFARYSRFFPQNTIMLRYEDFVNPESGAARCLIERLGYEYTEKQHNIIFKMGKVGATQQKPAVDDELRECIRAICSDADTYSVYPEYINAPGVQTIRPIVAAKPATPDTTAAPASAKSAPISAPPIASVEGAAAPVNGDSPATVHFRALMADRFQVGKLKGITPPDFRREIYNLLKICDPKMEGYASRNKQRDLSVKFHWGHNHDFGYFKIAGRMNDRHLTVPASFVEHLSALPLDLNGKSVLDVGAWTGGTSLLFSALGADVVAIEEVKKYAQAIELLKRVFDISKLQVLDKSLYDLVTPEFYDRFDYAYLAGLLPCVSDPVLALRIAFNTLKDGGVCLVESLATNSADPVARYDGPQVTFGGTEVLLNRGGWKWLTPSATALKQMMSDVGFTDIQMAAINGNVVIASGKRSGHCDIMRAGLSNRTVR